MPFEMFLRWWPEKTEAAEYVVVSVRFISQVFSSARESNLF